MERATIVKGALLAAASASFFYPGMSIAFAEQWPLYEALRTTAAIVFGVMGAWIALLYPEALTKLLGRRAERNAGHEPSPEEQLIERLIWPLIYSTLVISVILVAGIVAATAKTVEALIPYTEWLRGLSMSLLVGLTLLELWAVIMTLVSPERIIGDMIRIRERRAHVRNLQSLSRRKAGRLKRHDHAGSA